jgi:hypothetical protein
MYKIALFTMLLLFSGCSKHECSQHKCSKHECSFNEQHDIRKIIQEKQDKESLRQRNEASYYHYKWQREHYA